MSYVERCRVIERSSLTGYCNKKAVAKVHLNGGSCGSAFLVCKKCLPAYQYVQFREYGNTKSGFIVEKLEEKNKK